MRSLTAILTKEDKWFVGLCPELDIASQGATLDEAKSNLREAVELFLECADEAELKRRVPSEMYITSLELAVG